MRSAGKRRRELPPPSWQGVPARFHTSCIGKWGAHTFGQCQAAIGAADTAPVAYHHVDNPYGDGMVTRSANGIEMTMHRGDTYGRGSCGVRPTTRCSGRHYAPPLMVDGIPAAASWQQKTSRV